jgi:pilus assembly protein CpaB
MTPKRTIVVIAAVALGVVAATLSYVYLNNAQQRAYHNAKMVKTYVVVKAVPQTLNGTDAVNGGYLAQKSLPAEVVPSAAVTDLATIEGKEASSSFSIGQVVVASMFVSPTAEAGAFSQSIPAGDVAVTISVDQVHGVAGLAVPGDKVDLLITQGTTENALLQNVPVLAIGQQSANQGATSSNGSASTTTALTSGFFTFGVKPADAARIALAQQQSLGIYLLLVPPNNPVVPIPSVDVGGILNGPPTSG